MDGERRSLVGQVAVITAAAGAGIGGAIARRFLADGATVIASDVHERRLMILHEQTGAEVEVVDVGAPGGRGGETPEPSVECSWAGGRDGQFRGNQLHCPSLGNHR